MQEQESPAQGHLTAHSYPDPGFLVPQLLLFSCYHLPNLSYHHIRATITTIAATAILLVVTPQLPFLTICLTDI